MNEDVYTEEGECPGAAPAGLGGRGWLPGTPQPAEGGGGTCPGVALAGLGGRGWLPGSAQPAAAERGTD